MARKSGGNLPPERVLFLRHDVGITRTVRNGDAVHHHHVLDDQPHADCLALLLHLAPTHTANFSISGNKRGCKSWHKCAAKTYEKFRHTTNILCRIYWSCWPADDVTRGPPTDARSSEQASGWLLPRVAA